MYKPPHTLMTQMCRGPPQEAYVLPSTSFLSIMPPHETSSRVSVPGNEHPNARHNEDVPAAILNVFPPRSIYPNQTAGLSDPATLGTRPVTHAETVSIQSCQAIDTVTTVQPRQQPWHVQMPETQYQEQVVSSNSPLSSYTGDQLGAESSMLVAKSKLDSYEAFSERLQQALDLHKPEIRKIAKNLNVHHDSIIAKQEEVNLRSGLIIKLVQSVLAFDYTTEQLLILKNDCPQTELGMTMRNAINHHTKALGLKKYKELELMGTHYDALRCADTQRLRGLADAITMIRQLSVTEDSGPTANFIDRFRSDIIRPRTTDIGEELNLSSSDRSGSGLSSGGATRKASFEKLQDELERTRQELFIS
jgi:hypothetical protein